MPAGRDVQAPAQDLADHRPWERPGCPLTPPHTGSVVRGVAFNLWQALETFLSTGSRSLQIQATLGPWSRCGCLSLTSGAASVSNILPCYHTSFWFGKYGQRTLGKTGSACCTQRKERKLGAGPALGLAVPGEAALASGAHTAVHTSAVTKRLTDLFTRRGGEAWGGHLACPMTQLASVTPGTRCQLHSLPLWTGHSPPGLSLSRTERRGRSGLHSP